MYRELEDQGKISRCMIRGMIADYSQLRVYYVIGGFLGGLAATRWRNTKGISISNQFLNFFSKDYIPGYSWTMNFIIEE